jgi:HK97 family phage prohead protease
MERRFMPIESCPVGIEERDGEGSVIVGYASVFYMPEEPGTEYQLFPDLKERIMPRAFNKALQERHNAAALFNHDPNMILGRVSAGTVRLSKDQRGLRYEVKPPATRADVVESIRRGDVAGSSFGFRVLEQKFRTEEGIDIREIHSVELLDVSPVVYPAYTGTSTAVRAASDADEARTAHAAWKQEEATAAALADKLARVKARADSLDIL